MTMIERQTVSATGRRALRVWRGPRAWRWGWDWLARRPVLVAVVTAALSLALSLGLAAWQGVPVPQVHDEFAYLLGADTYAHGRLTNPPHALWRYFDTFHVLQQPTRMSKYPPGQSLFMALGQVLGHPIIGVFISTALMQAAFVYLFFGFLKRRWAVVASVVSLCAVGPLLPWNWDYWGGCAAALAGALAIGGLRWLIRRPATRHGELMSVGIALMAITRPLENLVLLAPFAVVLAWWLLRSRTVSVRKRLATAVMPLAMVGTVAVGFVLYNNRVVTGHWLELPYVEHSRQYQVTPYTYFGTVRDPAPEYTHPRLKWYWVDYCTRLLIPQPLTPGLLWKLQAVKWDLFEGFYGRELAFWPTWAVALCLLPWLTVRDRWLRLALIGCMGMTVANLLVVGYVPHYSAGMLGLLVMLVVGGLQRVARVRWGVVPLGGLAVAVVVGSYVGRVPYWIVYERPTPYLMWPGEWARVSKLPMMVRERVRQQVSRQPGKHVILVRYGPRHDLHHEWVYNAADVDGAKIVWARDLYPESSQPVLEYYPDRTIWFCDGDTGDLHVLRPAVK